MLQQPFERPDFPTPRIPFEKTFDAFLDLEWVEIAPASAHVRMEVRDNLKQPWGLLHGGVYSAVAESVASLATMHEVWQHGLIASGLSNTANFLRPVTAGRVDVLATLKQRTDTEWFWDHEFRDDEDHVCAVVAVVIAVRPFRPI